jgi:hypothetical protein
LDLATGEVHVFRDDDAPALLRGRIPASVTWRPSAGRLGVNVELDKLPLFNALIDVAGHAQRALHAWEHDEEAAEKMQKLRNSIVTLGPLLFRVPDVGEV